MLWDGVEFGYYIEKDDHNSKQNMAKHQARSFRQSTRQILDFFKWKTKPCFAFSD